MKSTKPFIYVAIAFALFLTIYYSMNGNEENYQFQINKYRNDSEKSLTIGKDAPISNERQLKNIQYFPINMDYRVDATIERFKEFKTLEMVTNQNEKVNYIYYATLSFELFDEAYQLILFQNQENVTDFFLPFGDLTNGDSSYGTGRYLNVKVSENKLIELDFNKAYNPYCAYNDNFSCPIPPKENRLNVKIEAGEKTFFKK